MKDFVETVMELIKKREFVSVATCDFNGRPNAAPKFVLKIDQGHLYLVDYTIGNTWKNLKANPRASLSFINQETLTGYQINGAVEMIDSGREYNRMKEEIEKKKITLTAKHIIEEVRGGSRQQSFEMVIPERIVIFKLKIDEVVEIKPGGGLVRKRVEKGLP